MRIRKVSLRKVQQRKEGNGNSSKDNAGQRSGLFMKIRRFDEEKLIDLRRTQQRLNLGGKFVRERMRAD